MIPKVAVNACRYEYPDIATCLEALLARVRLDTGAYFKQGYDWTQGRILSKGTIGHRGVF